MTDTQADLTDRARAILNDPRFPGLIRPLKMPTGGTFTMQTFGANDLQQDAIEVIAAALQSEREAFAAEARRATIEECARLVETREMSAKHGAWLWIHYLPGCIRALASPPTPQDQEETR